MNKRTLWSRILLLPGIVAIALGFNDPYDGPAGKRMVVLCVLSGIGLVALSAFLGKIKHRAYVYGVLGVGAIGLSARIVTWILAGWNPGLAVAEHVHLAWFFGVCAGLAGAALVFFEFLRAWMVSFVGLAMMAAGTYLVESEYHRAFPYVIGWLLLPLRQVWLQDWGNQIACVVTGTIMLAGSGLAALGAYRARSRHRTFLYVALGLTVCGFVTLILMVNFNRNDAAQWWEVFYVTYPIGLIMSCVGAVLVIVESFRRAPVSKDNAEST